MTNQLTIALERVKPEEVGISSAAVSSFIDTAREKSIPLHSFMLLRHGKVAAEAQYAPYHERLLHPIFSISKSVTSAAVGIAIGEGLLSLDDRVAAFFPEKVTEELHPFTAEMTVKHLLMMSTVHPKSTDITVEDWVKTFLVTPPTRPPGTLFAYDTTGTHTLCAILQKATGKSVHDYAREKLFDPIGIGPVEWETCPLGIHKGGSGIRCTTEDLARFGQLYLQKGRWNGRQILPVGWVELSTSKQIDNSSARMMVDGGMGYGFQFWRLRNGAYCAFGMGGQFVIVLPEKDAVFVTTANTMLYKDGQQLILDTFWETIYPYLDDAEASSKTDAYSALQLKLNGLSLGLPAGETWSALESKVSGQTYGLESNAFELEACRLTFAGEASSLRLWRAGSVIDVPFGMGKWVQGEDPFQGHVSASAAVWVDERTCVLHIGLLGPLQMYQLHMRFEAARAVMQLIPVGAIHNEANQCYLIGQIHEGEGNE